MCAAAPEIKRAGVTCNRLEERPVIDLTNRDYAVVLLEDIDLEAQLAAVRGLLRRNAEADAALAGEIREIATRVGEASGEFGMQLENDWVDHLHGSVFQDAAHSMSAVGMLVPMLESLLTATFAAIRDLAHPAVPVRPSGARAAYIGDANFWNPHYVFGRKRGSRDIARGVVQLADSTGLLPLLPGDFAMVADALFTYRNRMFHHGFEWPKPERAKFEELIVERGWPPDWFSRSTSGGEPWIIYMSDTLIRHSLALIDAILEGIGIFVQARYPHLATASQRPGTTRGQFGIAGERWNPIS